MSNVNLNPEDWFTVVEALTAARDLDVPIYLDDIIDAIDEQRIKED